MNNSIFTKFKSKLIFGKYYLKYLISKGSFGEVYLGTNILDNKEYALKIEKAQKGNSVLKEEAYILLLLKGPGLPSVITFGLSGKYHILVENLLGKSIYSIWLEKKKKFNLKDTCMFAIQALERIQYIHSKNFLHRDIKPGNFLVGNPDQSQIYLIDFGNAKKYRSSRTGKLLPLNKNYRVYGTVIFLSLNVLKGIEPTRKDELESLGLVFIYLLKGFLPWSNIKLKDLNQALHKIRKLKEHTSIGELCKDFPKEFCEYMYYIKNLNFDDYPNYRYLKSLFLSILKKIGEENDLMFSWVDKKLVPKRIISKKNKSLQKLYFNILSSNSSKIVSNSNFDISNINSLNNQLLKKNFNKNDVVELGNVSKNIYSDDADDNLINVIYSGSGNNNDERKEKPNPKIIHINNENYKNKISSTLSDNNSIIKNNTYRRNKKLKKIKLAGKNRNLILNLTNLNSIIKVPIQTNDKVKNSTNINFNQNPNIIYNKKYLNNNNIKNSNKVVKERNLNLTNNNFNIKNYININNININKLPDDDCSYTTIYKKLDTPKINIKNNSINPRIKSEPKEYQVNHDRISESQKSSYLNYKPNFYKSIFTFHSHLNKDSSEINQKLIKERKTTAKQTPLKMKIEKFNTQLNLISGKRNYSMNQRDLKTQSYLNSKINSYNPLFYNKQHFHLVIVKIIKIFKYS